jgi:hypothetical protein
MSEENNVGKWNSYYDKLDINNPTHFVYGNTVTYEKANEFLLDCKTVEDWGVGAGGFLRYRKDAIGVDGSDTCFATKKFIDLANYVSNCEGVHMRHVLEHNYNWEKILENSLLSSTKKVCIVLFVPFSDSETKQIAYNKIQVPDLSLSKEKFFNKIFKFNIKKIEIEEYNTKTQYKKEIIVKIELF